jgi:hypothetical protein
VHVGAPGAAALTFNRSEAQEVACVDALARLDKVLGKTVCNAARCALFEGGSKRACILDVFGQQEEGDFVAFLRNLFRRAESF